MMIIKIVEIILSEKNMLVPINVFVKKKKVIRLYLVVRYDVEENVKCSVLIVLFLLFIFYFIILIIYIILLL